MSGFCRNCGSPLADGQAFCTKCGTGVAAAAVPPPPVAAATPVAVPPPAYATPPVQAPPPAAAVRPTGVSPLVKILIAVVVLFVVFGACATVAMLYIGHRVHEKARELGLTPTDAERRASDRELRRMDGCLLLPKSMVSAALKMDVVRAENPSGGDPGCVYDVAGDAADLTAKHMSAMHKGELNKSQQDMMEDFAKGVFKSGGNTAQSASDHPGEAPVLTYSIDNNAAQLQMRLNKGALGQIGPVGLVAVPNLGDEAFDAYGAMLFVRKGDKLVRILYSSCPCALADILPLAKKIADGL
jgi:hypothetical protein